MSKRDSKFKKNLELLSLVLESFSAIQPRNFDDDPDFGDSFAFTFCYLETGPDEDSGKESAYKTHPIKAA